MSQQRRFAAVDLGAQSGRVGVAAFNGERVDLEIVHRFPNRPLWLPDGLHWNIGEVFSQILAGLSEAAAAKPVDSVGIDTWGCDYAFLDGHDRMLGLPFHYRDAHRSSQAVIDEATRRASQHEMYAATGIQTMPINTTFQLVSEPTGPGSAAANAQRIALIPDLLAFWLTGTLVNELTAASTTGLLHASEPRWATDLIDRLGIPGTPFGHDLTAPGADLGPILTQHAAAGNAVKATVRTTAGHDTASAFAAAPNGGPNHAVLSSGTWSLLGVHTPGPILSAEAERYNLTNERAFDGSTRLLRNVMGMWLVEECRREWGGADYDELYAQAAKIHSDAVPLFDPDHDTLLTPGPMVGRIAQLAQNSRQPGAAATLREPGPAGRAQLIRSILLSLACKYRLQTQRLEQVTGRPVESIQIVGGGAKNALLCQLTADITQRPVSAGPTEATLLGNALVQLLSAGEIATAEEMRAISAASVELERYEPDNRADGDAVFGRFLEVTGLTSARPMHASFQ